jgi:hypothetical protein
MEKDKFVICDCFCHALCCQFDKLDNELYLSMWHRSPGVSKWGWWQRLRWVWHVLITGEPYYDELVLNKESTKELIEYLQSLDFDKIKR